MTLETLIDAPPWRVAIADGTGDAMVLAFSSIGHDAGRMPSPEFVASARAGNRRALFFMDESRSFGLDPGFPALLQAALRAAGPTRQTLAIGSSMGAACALRAATHIPLDAIIALGPQSRLHDPRWQRWTTRLVDPGPPSFTPNTWTILCHGLVDDRDQAMAFPTAPRVDHLLFPALTHARLAPHLRERGLLQGLIDAALTPDRRRILRILASAGAVRRGKGMGL